MGTCIQVDRDSRTCHGEACQLGDKSIEARVFSRFDQTKQRSRYSVKGTTSVMLNNTWPTIYSFIDGVDMNRDTDTAVRSMYGQKENGKWLLEI